MWAVDREERPDIDHIYMSALHSLGEQGGWPLTMFLTAGRRADVLAAPIGRRRQVLGLPPFLQILHAVDKAVAREKRELARSRRARR